MYIYKMGSIQLITGPMFSGKSTELIRLYNRFRIANYECIFIKHQKDTRYSTNEVYTHGSYQLVDRILSLSWLGELLFYHPIPKVVCIDEGQFFGDINLMSNHLADNGHIVIIAALDSSFEFKPFENIVSLMMNCEYILKLTSVCMMCFADNAIYNKRITNECELEVIGGSDKYMSICRNCRKLHA